MEENADYVDSHSKKMQISEDYPAQSLRDLWKAFYIICEYLRTIKSSANYLDIDLRNMQIIAAHLN